MRKIIGLVGFIGSGKGSVAGYLCQQYNFAQDSFANSLKNVCSDIFNWPRHMLEGDTPESRAWREQPDLWWSEKLGIDDFTPRSALQQIGTNTIRDHFHKDLWILSLENRIRINKDKNFVISDGRFWNELEFLKNNNAVIIEIKRNNYQEWAEIAAQANTGNQHALKIMQTTYAHVHPSEWCWLGYPVDHTLYNTGSLEDLYKSIDQLMLKLE